MNGTNTRKALASLALVGSMAMAMAVALAIGSKDRPDDDQMTRGGALPEVVRIPAGEVTYRPVGNYRRAGKSATPAMQTVAVEAFEIMKYQVSRSDYAACVRAGACPDAMTGEGRVAQTNVSWVDASAYADWFSEQAGERWRLPSAPEWHRAAAERQGDAAPDEGDLDPGARMLSQYRRGVLLRGSASPALRPQGGFGENSLGVADMGGNVWEWTDGCMENGALAEDGSIISRSSYCGVRIAGGRHQAAVIDFVRDASVGGCAAGLPPDHLGFRLVRGE